MDAKINNTSFLQLLKLFIILQPILDILTMVSILFIDLSITVGIVIRVLFMLLSLIYIFFGNDGYFKKYAIIYLLLLFSVLGIGFVINLFSKPVFNLFMEAQWIAKTIYFSVMFCSFLLVFDNRENQAETKMKFLKYVSIAVSIVAVSILLSIITNTSTDTYVWVKGGFKGWFFSGNELSAIIAITFPLVYLYSIKKTNQFNQYLYWLPTVVVGIVAALIGTKVGLFALIGACMIIFVTILLHWLVEWRRNGLNNKRTAQVFYSFVITVLFIIIIPFTPSYTNLSIDMPVPDEENINAGFEDGQKDASEMDPDQSQDPSSVDGTDRELIDLNSPLLNKILSSRHIYFSWQYTQMVDAHIGQKIFGMGYAGNYVNNRKIIEMDFFDILFSFGFLGFIIIMLPLLILIGIIVKNLFTNFTKLVKIDNIVLITSISLGLGIALIAGHVWFAPAVSIYLAMAMILLLTNLTFKS